MDRQSRSICFAAIFQTSVLVDILNKAETYFYFYLSRGTYLS